MKIFGEVGYVRPEDILLIPVLKKSPKYVIYPPLVLAGLQPDIVLLFVNGAQMRAYLDVLTDGAAILAIPGKKH